MFFSNFLELYFRNRLRPRFFRNAPMNPFAQSIDRDATHLCCRIGEGVDR
jgi:hypothetical protein